MFQSHQIFNYCVNVKENTIYILFIVVTNASMTYKEKVPTLKLFYFTMSKNLV